MTNPVRLPFAYFMWDIPLLFDSKQYFFISHMISPIDLFHPPPAPHFKTLVYGLENPCGLARTRSPCFTPFTIPPPCKYTPRLYLSPLIFVLTLVSITLSPILPFWSC